MTAVPLLDHHRGGHCAPRPQFFRRLLRGWRRKPAVPEGFLVPSGTDRTGAARSALLSQAAHAETMHRLSEPHLPPPPRPVNGRNLGTQPRRHPPTEPVSVQPPRVFAPPTRHVLEQILYGLRHMDDGPTWGTAPQMRVAEAERQAAGLIT